MPILQVVVGTVIVFSKVGIGDLPAEFLNIIHQRIQGSEFSYWAFIFIYQRYSLSDCFAGFLSVHQVAR
jgi:hypothetical protein